MVTPEWWAEYKCPKCGYTTTVTNVCRSCQRWMFATGFEEKSKARCINLLIYKYRKLIVYRRRMTRHSDCYNNAIFASHHAREECKERKEEIPEWAWFGIMHIVINTVVDD